MNCSTTPSGSNGGISLFSSSSSEDESETDVASLCSTVPVSESEEDSDAVEGSYSCLRGDEDLLFSFRDVFPGRTEVFDPFSWAGLADL